MKHNDLLKDLSNPVPAEPEELIGQALYLLQLCQQDLNMSRKETIYPRAKRAKEACEQIELLFKPKIKIYKTPNGA